MCGVKKNEKLRQLPSKSGAIDDPDHVRGVELIYYGQLGLTEKADMLLRDVGYGRAHFRAMYVVAHWPRISGSELLRRLKVTNQSLSPLVKQLVRDGIIMQEIDAADRRQRLHSLTGKGLTLQRSVQAAQFDALARAYRTAGPSAVEGFLQILEELVPDADRALLSYPAVGISLRQK